MTTREQATYWGIAAAVLALVLFALGDVLLPFVLGFAIAYFLDPLADRLEGAGLSRGLATAIITVLGVLLFLLLVVAVIPAVINQTQDLIEELPAYFQQVQDFVNQRFPSQIDEGSEIREQLSKIGTAAQGQMGQLTDAIMASAKGLMNVVVMLLIVPVVSVYMLLDWDRMVAHVDRLLPRDHAPTIRRLASEIDSTLAGFVRGQGTVCLILGSFYAVALMFAGLNYGVAIGFFAGVLTFIPYIGAWVGGAAAIGVALFQFWGEWWMIAIVAGIFLTGQLVEGNILTPNLVGSSVGLHPVWLLLALSVFGSLFGFIGMLVAVPLAAVLGVLARFLTERYKDSPLYRGDAAP